MGNVFEKVMNVMGLTSVEDEFFDEEVESSNRLEQKETRSRSKKGFNNFQKRTGKESSRVVNIHTTTQLKVIVTTPETYVDAQEVADHIKNQKPVVVNLNDRDKKEAQKVMDFLAGACYALDGSVQRVAGNIFIIAPNNVDISGNIKEELRNRGVILPWVK